MLKPFLLTTVVESVRSATVVTIYSPVIFTEMLGTHGMCETSDQLRMK
jgi:hypothetical protein